VHRPNIQLPADTKAFLGAVGKEQLSLVTDGRAFGQWAKIDALGLHHRLRDIVVTDEWGKEFWKPHKRAFVQVQRDRDPSSCIYIGDNPKKDFTAPRALGWQPSFRIKRPGSLHENDPTPCDVREIESLYDLLP